MGRSKLDDRIGRLFHHPSGQDELSDKPHEEQSEARRGELDPVAHGLPNPHRTDQPRGREPRS